MLGEILLESEGPLMMWGDSWFHLLRTESKLFVFRDLELGVFELENVGSALRPSSVFRLSASPKATHCGISRIVFVTSEGELFEGGEWGVAKIHCDSPVVDFAANENFIVAISEEGRLLVWFGEAEKGPVGPPIEYMTRCEFSRVFADENCLGLWSPGTSSVHFIRDFSTPRIERVDLLGYRPPKVHGLLNGDVVFSDPMSRVFISTRGGTPIKLGEDLTGHLVISPRGQVSFLTGSGGLWFENRLWGLPSGVSGVTNSPCLGGSSLTIKGGKNALPREEDWIELGGLRLGVVKLREVSLPGVPVQNAVGFGLGWGGDSTRPSSVLGHMNCGENDAGKVVDRSGSSWEDKEGGDHRSKEEGMVKTSEQRDNSKSLDDKIQERKDRTIDERETKTKKNQAEACEGLDLDGYAQLSDAEPLADEAFTRYCEALFSESLCPPRRPIIEKVRPPLPEIREEETLKGSSMLSANPSVGVSLLLGLPRLSSASKAQPNLPFSSERPSPPLKKLSDGLRNRRGSSGAGNAELPKVVEESMDQTQGNFQAHRRTPSLSLIQTPPKPKPNLRIPELSSLLAKDTPPKNRRPPSVSYHETPLKKQRQLLTSSKETPLRNQRKPSVIAKEGPIGKSRPPSASPKETPLGSLRRPSVSSKEALLKKQRRPSVPFKETSLRVRRPPSAVPKEVAGPSLTFSDIKRRARAKCITIDLADS